jgi:hypothetical protein
MSLTDNQQGIRPDGAAPEKHGNPIDNRVGAGILLIVISGLIILMIYACSGTTESTGHNEFTYPKGVLDHKIVVIGNNSELDVTVKLRGWDAGATDLYTAIVDMESVMKHELQESNGEQSIVFHIVGDAGGGRDDYGHVRPTDLINVFDIQYSMDDLRQIDWEHLPGENRLLNIGRVSGVTEAGVSVARSYCQEGREFTQIFCANF